MIEIDNSKDAYIGLKVRIAYEKYLVLYNKHAEHDCQENNCNKGETNRIQHVIQVLNSVLEADK
jgi:hypothetical protein